MKDRENILFHATSKGGALKKSSSKGVAPVLGEEVKLITEDKRRKTNSEMPFWKDAVRESRSDNFDIHLQVRTKWVRNEANRLCPLRFAATFKASNQWMITFRNRHKLALRLATNKKPLSIQEKMPTVCVLN